MPFLKPCADSGRYGVPFSLAGFCECASLPPLPILLFNPIRQVRRENPLKSFCAGPPGLILIAPLSTVLRQNIVVPFGVSADITR